MHAFRTVVHDSGANLGFIISDKGFQAGAFDAAANANTRLVTWDEFQQELYERWFYAQELRLLLLADKIAEVSDVGIDFDRHKTLVSEAIDAGGDLAWKEFDELKTQYVEFAMISPRMLGRVPQRFPYRTNDPRVAERQALVTFKWPRMYFDIMFEAAPRAYNNFVAFVQKHTGGYCGVQQVFDDAVLGELVEGKTTTTEVRHLFGYVGMIHRVAADTEEWTFRGSLTRFRAATRTNLPTVLTLQRTLTIEFGPAETARRIDIKDTEYPRVPLL